MRSKEIISKLLKEKVFFMGVAILLVVLYHTPIGCVPSSIRAVLYPGFIGVDFFLFYSAYGLSYSICKRSIKEFYKRRFLRIMPLFLILAISKSLLFLAEGNSMTVFDWLCNLTTLSYYGFGGIIFDWYLCFLLLLYLLFPFFFKTISYIDRFSLWRRYLLYIEWLIIILFFSLVGYEWQYETAIARIPIFTLGLLCAVGNRFYYYKRAMISFTFFFVLSIILVYKGLLHTYLLIYQLAPIVLFIFCSFFFKIYNKTVSSGVYKIVSKIGGKTLEIYVANNISLSLMNFMPTMIPRLCSYLLLNVILIVVLVVVNNIIKNNGEKAYYLG